MNNTKEKVLVGASSLTAGLGVTNEAEAFVLPPGLEDGGSWLPAIRAEVRKELATGNWLQVRRPLPSFLRWLIKPWLRHSSPTATD